MANQMSFVFVVVLIAFLSGAVAQSSSCTTVLISMATCLNYLTSNSSTPSPQCCLRLATVVRSSPQCLCEALNVGGPSFGINVTQALALPAACHVKTPPSSKCPGNPPSGSPDTVPSGRNGSTIAPSTHLGVASDRSLAKFSFSLLVFLIFAATYGPIITS